MFESILDFLRGSDVEPENDEQRQRIVAEADYFGVPSLVSFLNAKATEDGFILVTIGSCPPRNVPRRFIRVARYNGFHELFRLFKKNYDMIIDSIDTMEIRVGKVI